MRPVSWLIILSILGCSASSSPTIATSRDASRGAEPPGAPAAPAPVPPNASIVTATVRKQTTWRSGSLIESRPAVANDRIHYSYAISILNVVPKEPKLDSFATPGMIVEVFSLDRLAPELVGKKIQATLQLTGNTRAVRWWISDIQQLPE